MRRNRLVNKNNSGTSYQAGGDININGAPNVASKSRIYLICVSILEADLPDYSKDKLEQPDSWDVKFDYNEVNTYKRIFENNSVNYQKTQEVFASLPEGDKVVNKINTIYNQLKINFLAEKQVEMINEVSNAGDIILLQAFNEVKYIIENDHQYAEDIKNNNFYVEDYEEAINSVLFYVFTHCRLLEVPPKNE